MVLMGGSLAAGCGGATHEGSTADSQRAGSGDTFSGDGGVDAGSDDGGNATVDAGSVDLNCPPSQWSCNEGAMYCDYSVGYEFTVSSETSVPNGCACDPNRPVTADDCASSETFVCLKGGTPNGSAILTVPIECSCVPRDISCQAACDAAWPIPGGGLQCEDSADAAQVLCSCAFIYLQ